jgi:hypothetical protein
MAISKKKFQKIAKKLISGIFVQFKEICPLYNVTGVNYSAQTSTKVYQTPEIGFIRIDYDSKQVDGQLIKANDFMLIGEYQELSIAVEVDKTTAVYKGEEYQIKNVDIDPADATIILQARRK